MTVVLLEHTLFAWEAMAEERAMHPADERARMVVQLRSEIAGQKDPDQELRRCLRALEQLDSVVEGQGGPTFTIGMSGRVEPVPESVTVTRAWRGIQQRWPKLITRLRNQVARAMSTERTMPLTATSSIPAGERQRYALAASALRKELGERFLDASTPMAYRAAQARKWKQLERGRRSRPA
jgi:hypothetical protein